MSAEALPAGTNIPAFTLRTEDGEPFTEADLQGKTTVLVFYPFAFSPVCTDQLKLYQDRIEEFGDAVLYGVSTDATPAQVAFKDQLGVDIAQLSDFEPKGETAKKLGLYFAPAGMTNRGLLISKPDGTVGWSHVADSPGDLPPVELVLEGLVAARA